MFHQQILKILIQEKSLQIIRLLKLFIKAARLKKSIVSLTKQEN